MSRGASPLRFLGLVLGGWLAGRAVFLAPAWLAETAVAEPARPPALAEAVDRAIVPAHKQPASAEGAGTQVYRLDLPVFAETSLKPDPIQGWIRPAAQAQGLPPVVAVATVETPIFRAAPGIGTAPPAPEALPGQLPLAVPTAGRWSLSSWAFVRRGGARQLATAGTLGGSQVGARATYALTDRLALSARLYSPFSRPNGAEAALGLEVQPLGAVPVKLLAERRQALGQDGRSAFAVLAHGGVSEQPVIGPLRLDAYAQAGVVGLRARDGFVDGAVRLGLPVIDNMKLGLGAWGAAQPGASRLDVGPQASYRLPVSGRSINASFEWRVRVAGDARPGSGPALTIATDF